MLKKIKGGFIEKTAAFIENLFEPACWFVIFNKLIGIISTI